MWGAAVITRTRTEVLCRPEGENLEGGSYPTHVDPFVLALLEGEVLCRPEVEHPRAGVGAHPGSSAGSFRVTFRPSDHVTIRP